MDITIGSLELNRSNPAHLGTKPLLDTSKPVFQDSFGNSYNSAPLEEKEKGPFQTFLMEAVNGMNEQQLNASALEKQIVTDPDSVDVHDVTTAMAKAQMSLDIAQTVINRLLDGWEQLSQNR